MVWFAPVPTNFEGLSADKIRIGILLKLASITAGKKLATAVPEVDEITIGSLLSLAIPRPKNAEERSSTLLRQFIFPLLIKACVNGELRAPGDMHACFMPCDSKNDTTKLHHSMF